ncbi:MAG: hypothetical protein ACKVT0_09205 [Planctomycetaceae bacterium]
MTDNYYLLSEQLKDFLNELVTREGQRLEQIITSRDSTRVPQLLTHVKTTASHGHLVKLQVEYQTRNPSTGTYTASGVTIEAVNEGGTIPDDTLCLLYQSDGEWFIAPVECT